MKKQNITAPVGKMGAVYIVYYQCLSVGYVYTLIIKESSHPLISIFNFICNHGDRDWGSCLDNIHAFYRVPKQEKSTVFCQKCDTNDHFRHWYPLYNHLQHLISACVVSGLSYSTSKVMIERLVLILYLFPLWCWNQENRQFLPQNE